MGWKEGRAAQRVRNTVDSTTQIRMNGTKLARSHRHRRRIIITVIIWCHASSIQPATLYTMPMSHDATDDAKTEGEREREREIGCGE